MNPPDEPSDGNAGRLVPKHVLTELHSLREQNERLKASKATTYLWGFDGTVWWLVEMLNGEPLCAMNPALGKKRAFRDSFSYWSAEAPRLTIRGELKLGGVPPSKEPTNEPKDVQQARIQAQEARTQRGTVLEILHALGLPLQDYNASRLVVEHVMHLRNALQDFCTGVKTILPMVQPQHQTEWLRGLLRDHEALADAATPPSRTMSNPLRELGILIGMDDYVPDDDLEYWSVENVRKHVLWLQERAKAEAPASGLDPGFHVKALRDTLGVAFSRSANEAHHVAHDTLRAAVRTALHMLRPLREEDEVVYQKEIERLRNALALSAECSKAESIHARVCRAALEGKPHQISDVCPETNEETTT